MPTVGGHGDYIQQETAVDLDGVGSVCGVAVGGGGAVGAVHDADVGGVVTGVSGVTVGDARVLLVDDWVFSTVVVNGEAELRWGNVAVAPDEESTEQGLGEQIQNTVKDSLGVGCDDVTTL